MTENENETGTQRGLQSRQNFGGNQIVGSKSPLNLERREAQSFGDKMCLACKSGSVCKTHNKCDYCRRWCVPDASPSSNDTAGDLPSAMNDSIQLSDVPIVSSPLKMQNIPTKLGGSLQLANRFAGTSMEAKDDFTVSLPAPGDPKRVFTVANFSSRPLKELISYLLGIQDPSDIDKLFVWVTTFSNEPPKFAQGFNENLSSQERQLMESLNQELNEALDNARMQDREFLTNEELEDVATRVLDSKLGSKADKTKNSSTEEVFRVYPIYPDNENQPLPKSDIVKPKVPARKKNKGKVYIPRLESKHDDEEDESDDESDEDSREKSMNGRPPPHTPAKSSEDPTSNVPTSPTSVENVSTVPPILPLTEGGADMIPSTTSSTDADSVTPESTNGDFEENITEPDIMIGSAESSELNNETESDEDDPYEIEEEVPITKELMQEVKQRLEERISSGTPIELNNTPNNFETDDETLGNTQTQEESQTERETLPSDTSGASPSLRALLQKVKEKKEKRLKEKGPTLQQKTKELTPSKKSENVGQMADSAKKTKLFPKAKDLITAMKNPALGSQNMEQNTVNDKLSETTPNEMVSSNGPMQDTLSKILQNLKEDVERVPEVIDDFETAQQVLKNMQNLIDEIKKATNIKADDIKDLTLGRTNQGEATVESPQTNDGIVAVTNEPEAVGNQFQNTPLMNIKPSDQLLQPQSNDNLQDATVGSQPLENVLWDKQTNPWMPQSTSKQNKDRSRLGSSPMVNNLGFPNAPEEFDNQTPLLQNRGQFPPTENTEPWSKSLGKLVPVKDDQTSLTEGPSNNMYFFGNGIKLPLQMVRKDDGEVQLSVDLEKLCSCKNNTNCPNNHTNVEQTIGSMLSQDMSEEGVQVRPDDTPRVVTNRNERGIQNGWLHMKNSIARHLDPTEEYVEGEDNNVFKRSTAKSLENESGNNDAPQKMSVPMDNGKIGDSKTIFIEFPNMEDGAGTQDGMMTFKRFLNNQFEELKTKMMDVERQNNQKYQQLEKVEQKLENALDSIKMENKKQEAYKTQKPFNSLLDNYISKSSTLPKFELNKNFKNQELFDLVTPINNMFKFKNVDNLGSNLEQLNGNENLLKKEADGILKTQKNSFIKKEVDIMNNILKFLKTLTGDKK